MGNILSGGGSIVKLNYQIKDSLVIFWTGLGAVVVLTREICAFELPSKREVIVVNIKKQRTIFSVTRINFLLSSLSFNTIVCETVDNKLGFYNYITGEESIMDINVKKMYHAMRINKDTLLILGERREIDPCVGSLQMFLFDLNCFKVKSESDLKIPLNYNTQRRLLVKNFVNVSEKIICIISNFNAFIISLETREVLSYYPTFPLPPLLIDIKTGRIYSKLNKFTKNNKNIQAMQLKTSDSQCFIDKIYFNFFCYINSITELFIRNFFFIGNNLAICFSIFPKYYIFNTITFNCLQYGGDKNNIIFSIWFTGEYFLGLSDFQYEIYYINKEKLNYNKNISIEKIKELEED